MSSQEKTRTAPRARLLWVLIPAVLLLVTLERFLCAPDPAPRHVELYGQTMGTTWSATVVLPEESGMEKPGALIQAAVNRVDSLMSTYKPQSELMRLNRNPSTEPVPVSGELADVLRTALTVSEKSGGALDVTVWPLVELWGFGASAEEPAEPHPDSLAAAAGRVGYRKLTLIESGPAVQKERGDVYLDVSAVAKGYGVDLACRALEEAGYPAFLVEVGGEIKAQGRHPRGRPWTIAVEKPDPTRREPTISIPLEDMAAATSGSYRNFIERDGARRSHILDPRTLAPVEHRLVSVTVLHPSAATADAWATALMVLGPEAGLAAASREGLAAYFITEESPGEYTTRWTEAWPPFS